MPGPQTNAGAQGAPATREDLLRIAGDVDERKTLDILALRPTVADLEEAVLWATGDGDFLAKVGHTLSGVAAEICEILTADEEEPPPVR